MKQKARYTIVRVDNKCPQFFENKITSCIGRHICDKCDFGDTKEQLIRKIAQVIKRERKNDKFIVFERRKTYPKIFTNEDLAKEIVEFLGVE